MNEEDIASIIRKYKSVNTQHDPISGDYTPDGLLWDRFNRAAVNQSYEGDATITRYAIWAKELALHIEHARDKLGKNENTHADELLMTVTNSLLAFSELQWAFDNDSRAKDS
ncbi:MAG: hypothetical protein JKY88_05415 [Pseudomonadales bacterium]|nr:hypothetical protein [Pseudomonadales bacterium]